MSSSATQVVELEQENTRLNVALDDAYAALGKTKTALERLQADYAALKHELEWFSASSSGRSRRSASTSTPPSS